MFAEHAFDVKHLGRLGGIGTDVTPLRDDRGMEAACPPALTLVPAVAPVPAARESVLPVRLPEGVYRRRRWLVALIAAAALTLAVIAARPDRVPLGEANPWPVAPRQQPGQPADAVPAAASAT